MLLDSIQIGSARPSAAGALNTTGIYKEPVQTAIIATSGLVDDVVVDTKNHGGPDQAVYLYTRDDYDYWERELQVPLAGGYFGENLTISGFASADINVGDRFELGSVTLEATAARIPCAVFQERMDLTHWVHRFREGARPGVYCRVIGEGNVTTGDEVKHTVAADQNITIAETLDLYYDRSASVERIEQALRSPIAERLRDDLERRLDRLEP